MEMKVYRLLAMLVVVSLTNTYAELTESEEDYILSRIIASYNKNQAEKKDKRVMDFTEFNNCPQEEPFPCKSADKCISLKHVCDRNYDCPDKWDEDEAVCIAYQRVPAEDLLEFVRQEAKWLVPSFFGEIAKKPEDLPKISSALSTSPNIDIFQAKLGLSSEATEKFETALHAVRGNDMRTLERFGMNPDSWTEVQYIFKNLIDSGLINKY